MIDNPYEFYRFFIRYPNRYFIETGSYTGNGITAALKAGCFERIFSVDLSREFWERCHAHFEAEPKVSLWLGDSAEFLLNLAGRGLIPATFWLDAHYSGGSTLGTPEDRTIVRELAALSSWPDLSTSTIIIDDFNGTDMVPIQSEICVALRKLAPDHILYYDMSENGLGRRALISSKPSVTGESPDCERICLG